MRRLAAVALLAVASCQPPQFDNPLSDPAGAKIDAKLVGDYRGAIDGHPVFVHVYGGENGLIDLVLVGDDDKKGAMLLTFQGFTTELGTRKFLNLKPTMAKDFWGADFATGPKWLFARYTVDAKGLTLWQMKDDAVKDLVKAGTIKGTVDDDDVVISSDTKTLAEWLGKPDTDKLFKQFGVFKKLPAK